MNFFGLRLPWSTRSGERKSDALTIDQVIARLDAIWQTAAGISVTPENCEESPTVQAIVNAISMHIATLPIHVYKKTASNGRAAKEDLPNHPVARLLQRPNPWQTATSYWLDATSRLVRYGKFYAYKARGLTGPIRRLEPLHPSAVSLYQDENLDVRVRVTQSGKGQQDLGLDDVLYARGRARDGLNGDSPVHLAREAIAMEIAAQRFGAQFFGNGAMPGLVFGYKEGFRGFETNEQRNEFISDFQRAYGAASGRMKAMILPKGIEMNDPIKIENDKGQFIEARKTQRTIIAGVFGVPPHLVGDLENGSLNNVEQQSRDFQQKVIRPYVTIFESAMERDLLTDEDRRSGVIIRFNMDANLRGSFKEQQESLKIMREAGALSPNEWREMVNMNPISAEAGGDSYWQQGPSGQSGTPQPATEGTNGT